jgi:hypothetical protein
MEQAPIDPERRNALILRRTLSAISWLYAVWTALFAAAALGRTTAVPYLPQLLLVQTALLAGAGVMLWKPRRGAVAAVLLAAAGSIFFVVLDLRRHSVDAAIVDGIYPVVAVALLIKSRARA